MPYFLRKKGRHLEDSVRNRFDYWKRVKNTMEMHETKQKSILFRKQILDDRVRANYQNEYERLRGVIAHTVVPEQTRQRLINRIGQLQNLGAQALPNPDAPDVD